MSIYIYTHDTDTIGMARKQTPETLYKSSWRKTYKQHGEKTNTRHSHKHHGEKTNTRYNNDT